MGPVMTPQELVDALVAQDVVAAKLLRNTIRYFLEDIAEYASWFQEDE